MLVAVAGIVAYSIGAAKITTPGPFGTEARLHAYLGWACVVFVAPLGVAAWRGRLAHMAFVIAICMLATADALETSRTVQDRICYTFDRLLPRGR